MEDLIYLDRERAVRELQAEVGAVEAERLLRRISTVMERTEFIARFRLQALVWLNLNNDGD